MTKLAVFILDALGADGARQLGMDNVLQLYRERGKSLTCSGIPHTAPSNSLIWSGEEQFRFWVKQTDPAQVEGRMDPAMFFDRDEAKVNTEAVRLWTRKDYDTPFLWDYVSASGGDATMYHIPLTLPPYNYGCDPVETDNWFPDTMERCKEHAREAVNNSLNYIGEEPDLFGTSIQFPDKWFHGMAEWSGGIHPDAEQFVAREAAWLDNQVTSLIEEAVNNGMEWVIMGDHGAPKPGALPVQDEDSNPFQLPRHRKHSIIISSLDDAPSYTENLFPWFCNVLDIDTDELEPGYPRRTGELEEQDEEIKEDAVERLKRLGYL